MPSYAVNLQDDIFLYDRWPDEDPFDPNWQRTHNSSWVSPALPSAVRRLRSERLTTSHFLLP